MVEYAGPAITDDSNSSGVSWGAVIAGAFVTAALSLALLVLGAGIGLSAVSPWTNVGASASTVGLTAILWLILIQLVASSVGGYLAGRLRTKWVKVHTHEVYFRDTAHGFLVWAVGLVITAAFLTSAAASAVGGTARTGPVSQDATGSASSRGRLGLDSYYIEAMLRPNTGGPSQDNALESGEAEIIFANGLKKGGITPADKSYLSQIVAAKTGLTEPEAEKRVDDAYSQTQQVVDGARKAVAHSMYWTFLALLIGAFCASFAATVGGKQRDHAIVI